MHRLIEEKEFIAVAGEAAWPDAFRIIRWASYSCHMTVTSLTVLADTYTT